MKAAKETRGSARATATIAKNSAKATRATARRTATEAGQTADATADAVEAEAKVRVNQVQQLAEKLVLVQVGAGLTVRDNVVSTVKGIRETVTDPSDGDPASADPVREARRQGAQPLRAPGPHDPQALRA